MVVAQGMPFLESLMSIGGSFASTAIHASPVTCIFCIV